jgi:hypothetical protein
MTINSGRPIDDTVQALTIDNQQSHPNNRYHQTTAEDIACKYAGRNFRNYVRYEWIWKMANPIWEYVYIYIFFSVFT